MDDNYNSRQGQSKSHLKPFQLQESQSHSNPFSAANSHRSSNKNPMNNLEFFLEDAQHEVNGFGKFLLRIDMMNKESLNVERKIKKERLKTIGTLFERLFMFLQPEEAVQIMKERFKEIFDVDLSISVQQPESEEEKGQQSQERRASQVIFQRQKSLFSDYQEPQEPKFDFQMFQFDIISKLKKELEQASHELQQKLSQSESRLQDSLSKSHEASASLGALLEGQLLAELRQQGSSLKQLQALVAFQRVHQKQEEEKKQQVVQKAPPQGKQVQQQQNAVNLMKLEGSYKFQGNTTSQTLIDLDQTLCATWGAQRSVQLFDLPTLHEVATLDVQGNDIRGAIVLSLPKKLVALICSKQLYLFDYVETPPEKSFELVKQFTLRNYARVILEVEHGVKSEKRLLIGESDCIIELLLVRQDEHLQTSVSLLQQLQHPNQGGIFEIRKSSRERELALSTTKGLTFLKMELQGTLTAVEENHYQQQTIPTFVEFLPDHFLLAFQQSSSLATFDRSTGKQLSTIKNPTCNSMPKQFIFFGDQLPFLALLRDNIGVSAIDLVGGRSLVLLDGKQYNSAHHSNHMVARLKEDGLELTIVEFCKGQQGSLLQKYVAGMDLVKRLKRMGEV